LKKLKELKENLPLILIFILTLPLIFGGGPGMCRLSLNLLNLGGSYDSTKFYISKKEAYFLPENFTELVNNKIVTKPVCVMLDLPDMRYVSYKDENGKWWTIAIDKRESRAEPLLQNKYYINFKIRTKKDYCNF